jgi:hypothetical protein
MELCVCEIETRENGVGAGVNTTYCVVRYTIVTRSRRMCCSHISDETSNCDVVIENHNLKFEMKITIFSDLD